MFFNIRIIEKNYQKVIKMKLKILLLLAIGLLTLGCSDDDAEPEGSNVLNYDGENFTAPTLPSGLYEYAVRFPSLITRQVEGRRIEKVSFYLYDAPDQIYINISPDLTPTLPGDIVNTQQVTNFQPNSWNTIDLVDPFVLDGNPVWVGIEVDLGRQMQTVGCDAGPANGNGDWLYDEDNREWATFSERTNQNESVNWNIRVILDE